MGISSLMEWFLLRNDSYSGVEKVSATFFLIYMFRMDNITKRNFL